MLSPNGLYIIFGGFITILGFVCWLLLKTVDVMSKTHTDAMATQQRREADSRDAALARHLDALRVSEEDKLLMTEQLLRDAGRNVSLVRTRKLLSPDSPPAFKRGWSGTKLATTPEQDAAAQAHGAPGHDAQRTK